MTHHYQLLLLIIVVFRVAPPKVKSIYAEAEVGPGLNLQICQVIHRQPALTSLTMEATQIMDIPDVSLDEQSEDHQCKVLASLEVLFPDTDKGTTFDIVAGSNPIGRDPDKCKISLNNKVSLGSKSIEIDTLKIG